MNSTVLLGIRKTTSSDEHQHHQTPYTIQYHQNPENHYQTTATTTKTTTTITKAVVENDSSSSSSCLKSPTRNKDLLSSSVSTNYASSSSSSSSSSSESSTYDDSLNSPRLSHRDSTEDLNATPDQHAKNVSKVENRPEIHPGSDMAGCQNNRAFVMDEPDDGDEQEVKIIPHNNNNNNNNNNRKNVHPKQSFQDRSGAEIQQIPEPELEIINHHNHSSSSGNRNNHLTTMMMMDRSQFHLKSKLDNSFISLLINGQKCLMMINDDHIAYEPELSPIITIGESSGRGRSSSNRRKKSDKINETDRVTIKLTNIVSIWICTCQTGCSRKKSSGKTSFERTLEICDCIKQEEDGVDHRQRNNLNNQQNDSGGQTKLINPSEKQRPFTVKIYYAQQTNDNKIQNPEYKLESLMMSIDHHQDDQDSLMDDGIIQNGVGVGARQQHYNGHHNNNMSIRQQCHLLSQIAHDLKKKIESFTERPKRLLVFVNPFSGNKKGVKIHNEKLLPIWRLSRITTTVIITERANQAKDFILDRKTDLKQLDGIVCVGGDGSFNEALHAVLIRTQVDNRINYGSIDAQLIRPSLKLGIIPAGSTDAVVYATCGQRDIINSVIPIVLGRSIQIDVGAVHNRDEETLIRYTASFMGYGFLGDTMLESEKHRWMGPKRYDWAGMKQFFKHRLYSGEIKLCLEPSDGSPKDYNPCGINCPTCLNAGSRSRGKLNVDDSPACISIRGRFLAINSALISCRCKKSKYGMSPMAHIGNGCADLILVSKCSRFQYLRYILSVAFHTKFPFEFNFIDSYRVREFEFNPIIAPHKRKGYMFEKSADYDFFDEIDDDRIGTTTTTTSSSSSTTTASTTTRTSATTIQTNADGSSCSDRKSKAKRSKSFNKSFKHRNCSSLSSSVWNCDGEVIDEPAVHVKIHCQLIKLYATGVDVGHLLDQKWN